MCCRRLGYRTSSFRRRQPNRPVCASSPRLLNCGCRICGRGGAAASAGLSHVGPTWFSSGLPSSSLSRDDPRISTAMQLFSGVWRQWRWALVPPGDQCLTFFTIVVCTRLGCSARHEGNTSLEITCLRNEMSKGKWTEIELENLVSWETQFWETFYPLRSPEASIFFGNLSHSVEKFGESIRNVSWRAATKPNENQYLILLKRVKLIFHANTNELNYGFIILLVVQISYLLLPTT